MVFAKYLLATRQFLKGHKEQLLFAGGVAGTITTGISGVKAGINIERKRQEFTIINGEPTKKDILKMAAPDLLKVGLNMAAGITCQSVNFVQMSNKIDALTSTAAALSTQIDRMKRAEREVLGEEKAKEIEKKVVEEPSEAVKESPTGKIWFKDFYTNAEFYTTYEEVARAVGQLNVRLTWEDVTTNEFFMMIDKADSKDLYSELGDENGWRTGRELTYRFGDGSLSNGIPCKIFIISERPKFLPKRAME